MQQKERRRYFRINDEINLTYRVLSTNEKNKRLQDFMLGEIEYPDAMRLYMSLESDISTLLAQIKPREPEIARCIHLLNRKINLISRGGPMSATQGTLLDEKPQQVNISACGVAFMSDQALQSGLDVQIEMVLFPEKTYILCYGVIIGCEKVTNASSFRVNVDFIAMREDDMDRLIQHIMQKEMETLKLRRQSSQEG